MSSWNKWILGSLGWALALSTRVFSAHAQTLRRIVADERRRAGVRVRDLVRDGITALRSFG